jgi:hypothetical protein
MLSKARGRLTFANVTSILALVVALGTGGAFAATQIDGSAIKKRSVPANRIKKDALTGKEIRERSLGKVPLAANAASLGRLRPNAFLRSRPGAVTYDKQANLPFIRLDAAIGDYSSLQPACLQNPQHPAPPPAPQPITDGNGLCGLPDPGFNSDATGFRVSVPGVYAISAGFNWHTPASGRRFLGLEVTRGTSSFYVAKDDHGVSDTGIHDQISSIATVVRLNAGDKVREMVETDRDTGIVGNEPDTHLEAVLLR